MIVDSEQDAGTQGDRQFDGEVGGGVSCYVFNPRCVIFVYSYNTYSDWQVILAK